MLLVFIFILLGIFLYFNPSSSSKRIERKRRSCHEISKRYPLAYKDYCDKEGINTIVELEEGVADKIIAIPELLWQQREINAKLAAAEAMKEAAKAMKQIKEQANLIRKKYPDGCRLFGSTDDYSLIISEDHIKELQDDYDHAKEENEKEQKRLALQKIEEDSKRSLLLNANKWAILPGNLHYTYLFDYYPTTCQFEATEEEWANRRIVWNFKNDKTKISTEQHNMALRQVVPEICRKLEETFDKETLKYLSLVCIPASTNEKNRDRYELFSQMLCEKTGMTNCFSKVTVIKDKTERRSGGSCIITENLSFDQSFFNNRYVLLFDDIITRGDSMRIMKLKLESLGATVVAGISIGKTKHERDAKLQGNAAQNTDRLIERRRFTENEISAVTNAVVTSSSDKRLTVAVFLKQGQPSYFPLYEGSNVSVGEYVNITQAYLRTSMKNGQRILEIEYNRPEYDLPF